MQALVGRAAARSGVSAACVVGPSALLTRSVSHSPVSRAVAQPARRRKERLDKLERKREDRTRHRARAERAEAVRNELEERERAEVWHKRDQAQELTKDLHPVSEELLQSIYTGLIEAKPEDLAPPSPNDDRPTLQLPSYVSLPDDAYQSRAERLASLNARLSHLARLPVSSAGDQDDAAVVALERVEALARSSTATDLTRQWLLPLQDWSDVACSLVIEGDEEQIARLFMLIKERASAQAVDQIVIDSIASLAETSNSRQALTVAKVLNELGIAMSLSAHHYVIESLLRDRVEGALEYLRQIEETGVTPLGESYNLVISTLLSPASPSHLVSRGWDLFAHSRLVSHPVPTADLYSTMIEACARGQQASPQRAADLFVEMTHDNGLPPTARTYNGLIRACARDATEHWYNEALRYLRQMLDENVTPTRATFHAVLEGARAHGDLARARWILVKMLAVGGDCSPDASTLGLVFQSYANHRPAASKAARTEDRTSVASDLVQFVEDGSISYPGPMPTSHQDVLDEAQLLWVQALGSAALPASVAKTSDESTPASELFEDVVPTSFLLNSYMQVLAEHDTFESTVGFFQHAYAQLKVTKNRFTYETIMARAERAEDRAKASVQMRDIFGEWQRAQVRSDERDSELLLRARDAMARGRNVSFVWSSAIRILARNDEVDEAVSLLEAFRATYEPVALVLHALDQRDRAARLPAQGSSARLSSPLYPETRDRGTNDGRPPAITIDMLRLLELRLVEIEERDTLKRVRRITNEYKEAAALARRVSDGRRDAIALARERVGPARVTDGTSE